MCPYGLSIWVSLELGFVFFIIFFKHKQSASFEVILNLDLGLDDGVSLVIGRDEIK